MKTLRFLILSLGLLWFAGVVSAQETTKNDDGMQNCPMHKEHVAADSHKASVEAHGDKAMGFPRDKTTHHFRMSPDGGTIEVTANDPNDKVSSDAIRSHLSHIAVMFKDGDFATPMFVHDDIPAGVTTMKLLKAKIQYRYEEIPSGGLLKIESTDPLALAGIHDFFRFQITEHGTGDTLAR